MRARKALALVGFLSLTVSCAHKPQIDEGAKKDQAKVEKKIEKKQANNQAYTCLVGKDKRLVTLDKKEKRCEVNYTKFGDATQVAWAESTPKICDDAFSNIRTNIEGAGYKCLDGADAKFEDKKQEQKPRETASN